METRLPSQRYHGLDALRAFAMLLGLVIHADLPYTKPDIIGLFEPGRSAPELPAHWVLVTLWIHQWRMPLFFLLAGFFGAMMIEKRGIAGYLMDRGLRVFGTLLVFTALFSVMFPKSVSELHHLWFLWVLTQLCAIAVIGAWVGAGRLLSPVLWALRTPLRMYWLALPLMMVLLFAKNELFLHVVPLDLTEFSLQAFIHYGFFFVVGVALWSERDLLRRLAEVRIWASCLGLAIATSVLIWSLSVQTQGAWPVTLGILSIGILAHIFGLIGVAQYLVASSGPILRFLVDSAYAVYLIHLYLVVGLGVNLILWNVPPNLAIPLSALGGGIASLAAYVIFVRYTPLDLLLAGPQRARISKLFVKKS